EAERGRLASAAVAPSVPASRALSPSDVLAVVRVFRRFHRLPYDEKRAALDAVRPRIYVGHYEVAGVWLDGRLFGHPEGEGAADPGGSDSVSPLKTVDGITTPWGLPRGGLWVPLAA